MGCGTIQKYQKYQKKQEVLELLNKARTNPTHFVKSLQQQIEMFTQPKQHYQQPTQIPIKKSCFEANYVIQTQEGAAAWRQAIKFLEQRQSTKNQPLEQLKQLPYLTQIAQEDLSSLLGIDNQAQLRQPKVKRQDTVEAIQRRSQLEISSGEISHLVGIQRFGQEGRQLENCLLSLIVDDGVKGKENRKAIFSEKYKYVGYASVKNNMNTILVLILADDLTVNARDGETKTLKEILGSR